MLLRTQRSPGCCRRETPRKRCPGGREDARGAVCYTSQWSTLTTHQRLHYKRSKRNCPDISSVLAIRKNDDQGRYDWHLWKVIRVNSKGEMRVSVEYYECEPREALNLHDEEWGIISCPEKRTAPSRERSAAVRQVLLNCVKLTHEMLFAHVPSLSIEYLRIGSCGVAIGLHCVPKLYQGSCYKVSNNRRNVSDLIAAGTHALMSSGSEESRSYTLLWINCILRRVTCLYS